MRGTDVTNGVPIPQFRDSREEKIMAELRTREDLPGRLRVSGTQGVHNYYQGKDNNGS